MFQSGIDIPTIVAIGPTGLLAVSSFNSPQELATHVRYEQEEQRVQEVQQH